MVHPQQKALMRIPATVGFALVLLVLYALTYQFSAIWADPQGIHFIRQTDSLAFASNYYHFGYGLFEPHTFSLESADGGAACEFPLLYYITGLIYHISGESFSVLRIINLSIISIGFLAAFQFIHRRITHFTIAATSTLLVITSTVVLYYASNALVDSAALGFTLCGIERLDRYRSSQRSSHVGLSILFFTLAALLKITFAIWPLAWFGALFSFKKPFVRRENIALLIPLTCSLMWFGFATAYNQRSGDDYFVTSSIPLWQLNAAENAQLIDAVTHYWIGSYYPPVTRWMLLAAFLLLLWNIRRIPQFEIKLLGIASLGIACYFLLMGRAFINHDYYFLPLVPLALLLLAAAGETFNRFKTIASIRVLSLALAILCCASSFYVRAKLERRYYASNDPFDDAANGLHDELNHHQLPYPGQKETVIVIGDPTRNGSLLYLKSKGITYPDFRHYTSAWDNQHVPKEASLLYSRERLNDEWMQRIHASLQAQGPVWYCYALNR